MPLNFSRIIIIGLGLIGGSIAKAVRRENIDLPIIAIDPDQDSIDYAEKTGLINHGYNQFSIDLEDNDLVIIAVPVKYLESVLRLMKPKLSSQINITVTDVISVKAQVLENIETVFGAVPQNFILGHPIAGAEKRGVENADENLFVGRKVILTIDDGEQSLALACVERFWCGLGAKVLLMDSKKHDLMLAATSHLPHLVAYCLLDVVYGVTGDDIDDFAGGGLRDSTRIAASNPALWSDILLANSANMLIMIEALTECLALVKKALITRDEKKLIEIFKRSKCVRNQLQD